MGPAWGCLGLLMDCGAETSTSVKITRAKIGRGRIPEAERRSLSPISARPSAPKELSRSGTFVVWAPASSAGLERQGPRSAGGGTETGFFRRGRSSPARQFREMAQVPAEGETCPFLRFCSRGLRSRRNLCASRLSCAVAPAIPRAP